jgi:hypothetical protein
MSCGSALVGSLRPDNRQPPSLWPRRRSPWPDPLQTTQIRTRAQLVADGKPVTFDAVAKHAGRDMHR